VFVATQFLSLLHCFYLEAAPNGVAPKATLSRLTADEKLGSQYTMKIVYLKKAGNDVISHCSCGDGRISFPPQMDCPWCGCGWLFTCITCHKVFTFAEGVELETTWEQLAWDDENNSWNKSPSKEVVREWVEAMKVILKDVVVGKRYAVLDGWVFPADSKAIQFDGWHARHRFDVLPQFMALHDQNILEETLGNRAYWQANALPEED